MYLDAMRCWFYGLKISELLDCKAVNGNCDLSIADGRQWHDANCSNAVFKDETVFLFHNMLF
jgi:hypothetical protein